ncbi:hypothetical protein [Herbaspirillum sp.]|uniref:hypothetical protein n=1 Tax=Herbaspirillum sp. TaxID=1890675 RepID=UPI001B07DEBD|nr:hypothetical protein [Herbaspirillum sp.]MBO9536719.1 hypothetical protein [Herbaspirillum sp.]
MKSTSQNQNLPARAADARPGLGLKPRQIVMLLVALVFVAAKSYEGLHTYFAVLPA